VEEEEDEGVPEGGHHRLRRRWRVYGTRQWWGGTFVRLGIVKAWSVRWRKFFWHFKEKNTGKLIHLKGILAMCCCRLYVNNLTC